ncbi:MAG: hypothetical protein WC346_07815 [Methanogenium sp.]|jgi:predicted SAM-dependent methyltransferase
MKELKICLSCGRVNAYGSWIKCDLLKENALIDKEKWQVKFETCCDCKVH